MRRAWRLGGAAAVISAVSLSLLVLRHTNRAAWPAVNIKWFPHAATGTSNLGGKYAYATFLTPRGPGLNDPLVDPYFLSVRLLAHQLLRDPATRTRRAPPIPFLVLALPSVPAAQLDALAADGVTIVPIEPLDLPATFDQSVIGRTRFRHVLAKLRLWQLTAYDKVLCLDADTMLFAPLDELFDHLTLGAPMPTRNTGDDDVGDGTSLGPTAALPLPPTYLLAASADTWGNQTDWAASGQPDYLCACFMLLAPSDALFAHYERVLASPQPLFQALYPDQDLLIHAHRLDGPMPWRKIPMQWSANDGALVDERGGVRGGVRSLHVKAWKGAEGSNAGGPNAERLWEKRVASLPPLVADSRA